MNKSLLFLLLLCCFSDQAQAQAYADSMQGYQQRYVQKHTVVTAEDKQHMHFFPVSAAYKVTGTVQLAENSPWFLMESSGPIRKMYRVYAAVSFPLHDTLVQLQVYQSQSLMQTEEYKDHLFLPFTDATSGAETYISGRYLDLSIKNIKDGKLVLDFNKAYNPYCAYVSGRYNCPIPPKENRLAVAIRAGEKNYSKTK